MIQTTTIFAYFFIATGESISAWNSIDFVLNNAVAISILFIFLSALFGFFMKARSIDKCLKDFASFTVTLETINGEKHKGVLNMFHTGMEFSYKQARADDKGYFKHSQILYSSEYVSIKKISRLQSELTEKNNKKREKSIKKTYEPGLSRRISRKVRNVLGTFRDAVSESFTIILGQLKKTSPSSQVLTQDKHLKSIGHGIVEHSGNVYDPILEKYIGRHVVVETIAKEEIYGIFKEYSQNYLELLNVQSYTQYTYNVSKLKKEPEYINLDDDQITVFIWRSKKKIHIKNLENFPIFIFQIGKENEMSMIKELLEPKATTEIAFKQIPLLENMDEIVIEYMNPTDIILPRSIAFVRYCADERKLTWKEALKTDFQHVWSMTKLK